MRLSGTFASGARAGVAAVLVGAVTAGLVTTGPSPSQLPGMRRAGVRLTGADTADPPAGAGVALVMGGSGTPTPPQTYLDAADALYLRPNGFTGTPAALTTIEGFIDADKEEREEAPILTKAVESQIAAGHADAENPLYVFAYSQSAAFSTFSMQQLHADGVPSSDVHFVMIGDPVAPNGGFYTSLDIPPGTNGILPINDTPLGNPTPDDLYPADIYTLEYDPVGDFPHYPLDLLSDLNAFLGLFLEHIAYLGLDAGQIADAEPLETAGDTLDRFFMIHSEFLPLLVPVLLVPVIGKPLYDLLEPDARILVNLGYGSIADGWNQGPANVEAPLSLSLPNVNLGDLAAALTNGLWRGMDAAFDDLLDPATYRLEPIVDNPALAAVIQEAYVEGDIDTPHPSSIFQVLGALLAFLSTSSGGADSPAAATGDFASLADGAGGLLG